MQEDDRRSNRHAADAGANAPATRRNQDVIDVKQLLKGSDHVDLLHNGEIYRLRITSKRRLILTK